MILITQKCDINHVNFMSLFLERVKFDCKKQIGVRSVSILCVKNDLTFIYIKTGKLYTKSNKPDGQACLNIFFPLPIRKGEYLLIFYFLTIDLPVRERYLQSLPKAYKLKLH